jgi:predicted acetyltransferase
MAQKITRKNQRTDTIYVGQDGSVFVTPDGEGRYWYDSVAEAQAQHGDDLPIRHVLVEHNEW